ncbi:hypothetical protein PIB30_026612 [Stylosanthes scabra]|uniref:Uncharacterized protein n=1 Tax=Stylosanthes scabra TaxID=79078 RepID=A0ABU6W8D7_9FABA|nr:hypothetical protein [Stylosanthes scabra]
MNKFIQEDKADPEVESKLAENVEGLENSKSVTSTDLPIPRRLSTIQKVKHPILDQPIVQSQIAKIQYSNLEFQAQLTENQTSESEFEEGDATTVQNAIEITYPSLIQNADPEFINITTLEYFWNSNIQCSYHTNTESESGSSNFKFIHNSTSSSILEITDPKASITNSDCTTVAIQQVNEEEEPQLHMFLPRKATIEDDLDALSTEFCKGEGPTLIRSGDEDSVFVEGKVEHAYLVLARAVIRPPLKPPNWESHLVTLGEASTAMIRSEGVIEAAEGWFSAVRGGVHLCLVKETENVVSDSAEDDVVARVTNEGFRARLLRRFVLLTSPPLLAAVLPWNLGGNGEE